VADTFLLWILIPWGLLPMARTIYPEYFTIIFPIFFIPISKFLLDITNISYIKTKKKKIACKTFIRIFIIILLIFIFFNLIALRMDILDPKQSISNLEGCQSVKYAVDFLLKDKVTEDKFVIFEDLGKRGPRSVPYIWQYFVLKGQDYSYDFLTTRYILRDFSMHKENIKEMEKEYILEGFTIYYLINSEQGFNLFRKMHPQNNPIKVINYASGKPAINIYEVKIDNIL